MPVVLTSPYKYSKANENRDKYWGFLYDDKSYLLNDALWDRYYFSAVSQERPMGYFVDRESGREVQYNPNDIASTVHVSGAFNPRIGYFGENKGCPYLAIVRFRMARDWSTHQRI